MVNLLKNNLPLTVMVGGISYDIDFYYDTALAILDLLSDTLWTRQERLCKALEMFYGEIIPPERDEALGWLIWFLNGGETEEHEPKNEEKRPPVIDFDIDGNLIYTAFLRVYNWDLKEKPVHWWKFKVMLEDLGETPALENIMRIRTTPLEDVPEKKRGEFKALKNKLSLGDYVKPAETLEERNRRWRES